MDSRVYQGYINDETFDWVFEGETRDSGTNLILKALNAKFGLNSKQLKIVEEDDGDVIFFYWRCGLNGECLLAAVMLEVYADQKNSRFCHK